MKRTNMKKGITLIEIILAIVLVAIIMGLTIPKLMENSDRAEIKQVITSDVRAIVEAATLWKRSSSASNGNYIALGSDRLRSRLPDSMAIANGVIFSSGLNTGTAGNLVTTHTPATGVTYIIDWDFANQGEGAANSSGFGIGMDIQNGATDLNWNNSLQAYALDVFRDMMAEMTNDDSNSATYDSAPVNVGASFPCDADTTVCFDGIILD